MFTDALGSNGPPTLYKTLQLFLKSETPLHENWGSGLSSNSGWNFCVIKLKINS